MDYIIYFDASVKIDLNYPQLLVHWSYSIIFIRKYSYI